MEVKMEASVVGKVVAEVEIEHQSVVINKVKK